MNAPQALQRLAAQREAIKVIEEKLGELSRPGFFGRLPLELHLQDGIVCLVTTTGVEETHKIRLKAA